MFGIALSVILTHAAAAIGGTGVGAYLHSLYLKVKADIQADEASVKARIAALEAAYTAAQAKTTTTPPPAA